MNIPSDLKYTKDHEWIRANGSKGIVGITQFAADQLGDVVFVDLPQIGRVVAKSEAMISIESVKAVSDVYAPVSGKIVRVNAEISKKPEDINSDSYGIGWLVEIEITQPDELNSLLAPKDYETHVASHT